MLILLAGARIRVGAMKDTLWWSKTFKRDAWFHLLEVFEDDFVKEGSPPAMMLLFQDLPGSMTEVFIGLPPEQKGLLSNYPGFQPAKPPRRVGLLIGHQDRFAEHFEDARR